MAEATLMPRPIGAYPGAPAGGNGSGNGFVSYYRDLREDDLGRSAVQHKPLNKGPHTQISLTKSFADTESSQRPRVWAPPDVNKPHTPLTTADIQGATCKVRGAARGTDPVEPRYTLPTNRHSPGPDPILSIPDGWAAGEPGGAPRTPRSAAASGFSHPLSAARAAGEPDLPAARDPLRVSDIEGAAPTASKAYQPQLQNLGLDVSDVEGAQPGWKPPFRAHVGVRLRDPGLQVSDINGYMPRRKGSARRPDDPWVWASGTLNGDDSNGSPRDPSTSSGAAAARPRSAFPGSSPSPTGQQCGSMQPVQHEFTGLPAFQVERQEVGDGGIPPSPLEPPTEASVVAVMLAGQQQGELTGLNHTISRAQREQRLLNTGRAHELRVGVAEERVAARAAATRAAEVLAVDREGVERLWGALKSLDREGSGKVTVAEFGRALELSGVSVTPQALRDLVSGMRDGVGLVPYKDLSKSLLWRAKAAAKSTGAVSSNGRTARPRTAVPGASRGVQPPETASPSNGGAPGADAWSAAAPACGPTTAAVGPAPAAWQASPYGSAAGGAAAPSHQSPPPHSSPYTPGTAAPPPSSYPHTQQQSPAPAAGTAAVPGQSGSQPVSRPASATPSRAPSSTAVRAAYAAGMPMEEEAAVAAALAGGSLPPGAQLLGPEGAKYFTFKGRTYWFSGNDTREALAAAATEYKAVKDETYSVTVRQMRLGLGDGGPLAEHTQSGAGGPSPRGPSSSPRGIRDAPTVSSCLKSGALTQDQLAVQMETLHHRPQSPATRQRAHTARPGAGLQAAPRSGASMGAALWAAVRGPGAGGLGHELGAGRPVSAGPRLGTQHQHRGGSGQQALMSSFTSVANSGAKAGAMTRLERAVLREDVATVRTLL